MDYGLFLPQGFGGEFAGYDDPVAAYDAIAGVARTAEEAGFGTAWLPDHLHPADGSQSFVFENWTTAAALARDTGRIRIGQLVTGNGYRNPALQAKMASTLDVLAGGRYTFGIGAGWWEPDYRGYGYEFGTAGERLRRLEEAVRILLALWTEDEAHFAGEYYRVDGAINRPKGVQRPHVPLLIAGNGEKHTLRLVANYADACNLNADPAGIRHKLDVLRAHCETAGRDYDAIRRTAMVMCVLADTDEQARAMVPPGTEAIFPWDVASYGLVGTPDTVARRVAAFEAAGVQDLVIGFLDPFDTETIRRFGKELIG